MDITNISLGFDIATAISIIGASVAYIRNTIKERKVQIGEERQNLRVAKLVESQQEYNELLGKFVKYSANGRLKEALETMDELYHYSHYHLRRVFTQYANQEDVKLLNSRIKLLLEAKSEYDKNRKFDVVKLTNSLVELDMNILIQIRQLMNNEELEDTKDIVEKFAIERFGYIKS